MSRIKGKNTKPEILVRKYLHSRGYRFRLHSNNLPGKPDIVLPKYKTAIFVNGCFWHGHRNCKNYVTPKTRTKWWIEKVDTNRKRDQWNIRRLKKLDWKVISIWECTIKSEKQKGLKKLLSNLSRFK